ncbi:MAG TPA: ArsI/CadI family heavy metal resistance metalloenzyme [Alphaproteobacteria bacterium]|nr:ArsI/CadI family heavy metal resistance metalloenzyme [Alphaproteobacteria bacterium]
MQRLHLHLAVAALEPAVHFYSTLFGIQPTVLKKDYAKWRLDDPRVNFAISRHGDKPGLDHLGIEVDSREELEQAYERLSRTRRPILNEGKVTCCYARSEKAWVTDPAGIAWEAFHTSGEAEEYGQDRNIADANAVVAGCGCGPA